MQRYQSVANYKRQSNFISYYAIYYNLQSCVIAVTTRRSGVRDINGNVEVSPETNSDLMQRWPVPRNSGRQHVLFLTIRNSWVTYRPIELVNLTDNRRNALHKVRTLRWRLYYFVISRILCS